jgi:4-azaleucine resistance transporter AzlC
VTRLGTRPAVGFSRAGIRRGVIASIPPLIGVIPFGLVCGIVSQGNGFSFVESVLLGGSVFAGSAELVALAHWSQPAPVLAATFAAFVVNFRMALMGPVLAPWYSAMRGWRRFVALATMVDQGWALGIQAEAAGETDAGFLFGAGVAMWASWTLTGALGHLAGAALRPPPGHPIFFAALAVFVALLVTMWRGRVDVLPWLTAAAVALVTAWLLPGTNWYIVAGAVAGAIAGAARDTRQERAR